MKKILCLTVLLTSFYLKPFAQTTFKIGPCVATADTVAPAKTVAPAPEVKVKTEPLPPFWNDILAFKQKDSSGKIPEHPILFVGSSSFNKWTDMQDYFSGYPILNRGFGGSILKDVIRYTYDIILPYNPKQVLIYCGDNDLASGASAEEVIKRFKTLYGMIRTNLPDAVIDFVAIKYSPSRERFYPKITETNSAIKAFLKNEKKAGFIDINPDMLDINGHTRDELFLSDRLHLKPAGYEIWKKVITPYLIK